MLKKNEKEVDTLRWDENEVVNWFICWDIGMVYQSHCTSDHVERFLGLLKPRFIPKGPNQGVIITLLVTVQFAAISYGLLQFWLSSTLCSIYVEKWNHLHLKSHWPWGWRHAPQCPDTEVIERMSSRSKITSTPRLPALIANFGIIGLLLEDPPLQTLLFSSPFLHSDELCACLANSEICLHSTERKDAALRKLLLLSWSLWLWIWLLPVHNVRVSDVFKMAAQQIRLSRGSQEYLLKRSSIPVDVHHTLFPGWISYFSRLKLIILHLSMERTQEAQLW